MNKVKLPYFKVEKTISVMSETIDWGLAQNDVPEAWKTTMGEGITVYVLDTGAPDHIDLKESFLFGVNCSISKDEKDRMGHSSHCCGIIAADQNGIGVVGVAPKAKIVTVKCLGDDGTGGENEVCNALEFCLKARLGIEKVPKPDIISMSLGTSDKMRRAHKLIAQLTRHGIPIVCAVGNEASKVCYPAAYEETIAVGAYDRHQEVANFSNFGKEVDFVAPGKDIYSTYLNNSYAKLSGSCLVADTMVYTTNGPKKICGLTDSDYVWSFNGRIFEPKRVLRAWSNGEKETLKIRSTNGHLIECTGNHPFLMPDSSYKQASELSVGDEIVTNSRLSTSTMPDIKINSDTRVSLKRPFKITIPEAKEMKEESGCKLHKTTIRDFFIGRYGCTYKKILPIINGLGISKNDLLFGSGSSIKKPFPIIDEDFCWLGGFYLCDGWVSSTYRSMYVCFAYGDNKAVQKNICDKFYSVFGDTLSLDNASKWYYKHNDFACKIILQMFNKENHGAKKKDIPKWLFSAPRRLVIPFVCGLIDADGNVNRNVFNGYSLGSSSRNLIYNFAALCDYHGIPRTRVLFRERMVQPPCSPKPILVQEYSVNIKLTEDEQKYIVKKHNKPLKENNTRISKIKSIEVGESKDVWDIEVEDNHNFIANGFVVHNSMATPFVAGIIALMLSKHLKQEKETGHNDCETVEQIKGHLIKYSIDIGPKGKDKKSGFGIINIDDLISKS